MKSVKTVGIIFMTKDGRIVLQRRDGRAPTSPNKLALFGGHMREGEEPLDAISREVHEETSIPPEDISYQFIDLITVPPAPGHDVWNPVYVFMAVLKDEHFKVFEGKGAEKYKPEEIWARHDLGWGTHYALTHLKERNIWH